MYPSKQKHKKIEVEMETKIFWGAVNTSLIEKSWHTIGGKLIHRSRWIEIRRTLVKVLESVFNDSDSVGRLIFPWAPNSNPPKKK